MTHRLDQPRRPCDLACLRFPAQHDVERMLGGTRDLREALLELVRTGAASADSLRESLAIVIEERRNYDPTAASAALLDAAPLRTIIVDTQRHGPDYVAARIVRFVQQYM